MNKLIQNIKPIGVKDIVLLTALSTLLGFVFLLLFGNIISGVILTVLTLVLTTYIYTLQKGLKTNLTLSEDLLSSIFNNSSDSMFLLDIETNTILDCNDSALEAFEVKNKSEFKGKYITHLCKDGHLIDMPRVVEKLKSGDTWSMEMECNTYNNKIFWGSFAAKRIKVSDGNLDLLRISNVTKLKDTEATLEQQNITLKKEKKKLEKANQDVTMLLKEVHHRVKNNLQVVTSMLRLQTSFIEDEAFKEVFRDSLNRIMTMSIIHEKLYFSEALLAVDLREYLKELVGNIMSTHPESSVSSNIEIDEIEFPLDVIVPLGLLLNELVTNSLKHAFDDNVGVIDVTITNGDGYTLTYADNGKGLPKDYDIKEEKTFGCTLISALVDQLEGELEEVPVEKGMCYKIHFKGEGREEIRVKV